MSLGAVVPTDWVTSGASPGFMLPDPSTPAPPPPQPPQPPTPPPTPPPSDSGWTPASLTWYGPGDVTGSNDPIGTPVGTGWGSCLFNFRSQVPDALLTKYRSMYAAVNDLGTLFGGGQCQDNADAPEFPICDNQQNCGQCYEIRCVTPCLRFPGCSSSCTGNSVTVLMVDACPSVRRVSTKRCFVVQVHIMTHHRQARCSRGLNSKACVGARVAYYCYYQLSKQGFNGCIAAARAGANHFDVSKFALGVIVQGDSGEVGVEYRNVPC